MLVLILFGVFAVTSGQVVTCGDGQCRGSSPPQCTGGVDCEVKCEGRKSCQSTTLACPSTNGVDCTIRCLGSSSCQGLTVNCEASTKCKIICEDFQSCQGLKFNCAPFAECHADCDGSNSCGSAVIKGDVNVKGCFDPAIDCVGLTIDTPPPTDAPSRKPSKQPSNVPSKLPTYAPIVCTAGKYLTGTGATSRCLDCPRGKWQNEISRTFCKDCDRGTYSAATGRQTPCPDCPAGQQGNPWSACRNCGNGRYAPQPKTPQCLGCPAGRVSNFQSGSRSCRPNPPPACEGDPHFVTWDGRHYDFMGCGEYITMTTPQNDIMVQGRFENWKPGDDEVQATITTGMAVRAEGTIIEMSSYGTDMKIFLNGTETSAPIDLGLVTLELMPGFTNRWNMSMVTGVSMLILKRDQCYIDVVPIMEGRYYWGRTLGLFGTFDNQQWNDLTLPNGTILLTNDTTEIFHGFGEMWRVPQGASLFQPKSLTCPKQVKLFDGTFKDSQLEADARDLCGNSTECLFDVAVTGNLTYGQATLDTQTLVQSLQPTEAPTWAPTELPTGWPTSSPTVVPTGAPSGIPSQEPTAAPILLPSSRPTVEPSVDPTQTPTTAPIGPSPSPTSPPTQKPTSTPTQSPTRTPTSVPTGRPTSVPTSVPTQIPSTTPTQDPTKTPTSVPTRLPTMTPTTLPTEAPTNTPTQDPTNTPTSVPTRLPTTPVPTGLPTKYPSRTPTTTRTLVGGDPHFVTSDGLRYSFQGLGEYRYLATDDGRLDIQLRLHAVGNASAIQGLAMRLDQTHVVAVWNGTNTEQLLLWVNGEGIEPWHRAAGIVGIKREFESYPSGKITLTFSSTPELVLQLQYMQRSTFSIASMPPKWGGKFGGLAGNGNDDVSDDLSLPDGTTLPIDVDARTLHKRFGQAWQVSSRESLFPPDLENPSERWEATHNTDRQPIYETIFHDEQFKAFAEQVCDGHRLCLYDAASTGDLRYAKMTKHDFEQYLTSGRVVVDAGTLEVSSSM